MWKQDQSQKIINQNPDQNGIRVETIDTIVTCSVKYENLE